MTPPLLRDRIPFTLRQTSRCGVWTLEPRRHVFQDRIQMDPRNRAHCGMRRAEVCRVQYARVAIDGGDDGRMTRGIFLASTRDTMFTKVVGFTTSPCIDGSVRPKKVSTLTRRCRKLVFG